MDRPEGRIEPEETQADATEQIDLNRNGLDDVIEPPPVDVIAGSRQLAQRLRNNSGTSPELSGGDIDARWEDAESSGDESVGGSTAIPGQNNVDDLGKAIGVSYAGDEELTGGEKQRQRDEHRWERDPASSDDYHQRTTTEESEGRQR